MNKYYTIFELVIENTSVRHEPTYRNGIEVSSLVIYTCVKPCSVHLYWNVPCWGHQLWDINCCMCVCVCVCQSVRRHIAILRQE